MKKLVILLYMVLVIVSFSQPVPQSWVYQNPNIAKWDSEFWFGILSPVIGTIETVDSAKYVDYWQNLLYRAYIRYSDPRFQSTLERQRRVASIKKDVDSTLKWIVIGIKQHPAYMAGAFIGIAASPKLVNFKIGEIRGVKRITKLTLELEECELIVEFKSVFWDKIITDHASCSAMRRGKSLFLLPNEDYISTVLIGFNPYQKRPHFNKFHHRYQLTGEVFGTDREYKLVLSNLREVGKKDGKPIYKAEGFNFYPLDNIKPFDLKKVK